MRSKTIATLLAATCAVVKGPVLDALVTVTNALTGVVLGTTRTLPGNVVIQVSSGNYIDEATLALTVLAGESNLTYSFAPNGSANPSITLKLI